MRSLAALSAFPKTIASSGATDRGSVASFFSPLLFRHFASQAPNRPLVNAIRSGDLAPGRALRRATSPLDRHTNAQPIGFGELPVALARGF